MPRSAVLVKAIQDRKGQIPWANSWGAIILAAIPNDDYVTTNNLYDAVVEKYPKLEFHVCKQYLCYLRKRELIERQRVGFQMQQRRIMQLP